MSDRQPFGTRRRDERGLVLPTRLMVLSISFIVLAGLGYVAMQPDDGPQTATPAGSTAVDQPKSTPTPTSGPTTVPATPKSTPKQKSKPQVRRAKVNVEVYNNSNITGLAGKTASRAEGVGWNVLSTDNWYGTIETSTVYHGAGLKAAAALLAKDLGITRVKPAVRPMRSDRLTVILTGDYR